MTEFHSPHGPLTDHLPDDLTVVQFMLDYHHPMRQVRPASSPWFIDDTTGRQVFYEEVRTLMLDIPPVSLTWCRCVRGLLVSPTRFTTNSVSVCPSLFSCYL